MGRTFASIAAALCCLAVPALAQFPGPVSNLVAPIGNPGNPAATGYTIIASAPSSQGGGAPNPQRVSNAAVVDLTAGANLFVITAVCGDNSCSGPALSSPVGPKPTSVSVTGGAVLGACNFLINTDVTPTVGLYTELCPIAQGATGSNVTVSFSADAYYALIYAVVVSRSPSGTLTDEGVGGNFFLGNATQASIGPMTPTTTPNFVIAAFQSPASGIVLTPGSGFSALPIALDTSGNQFLMVEYEVTLNTNPVTATASASANNDLVFNAAILN